MRLLVFSALLALALSKYVPFDSELDTHWENFKRVHGKQYTGTEESGRRLIWEGHVREAMHHNLAADMGLHSYRKGVNEYSDLSHEEFLNRMTCFRMPLNVTRTNGSSWLPPSHAEYPTSVDWRNEGLVTPVKSQGHCGSCWAFSATGSLEGQHKKKTGALVSLSEQNLVDCTTYLGNLGCAGGVTAYAFMYIRDNGGIDTEESYPYEAKNGVCRFRRDSVGATCTGYVDLPQTDENALMQAVATVGPVSVAVDATNFQAYKGGIFDEPSCNKFTLNHGVLVVGYGTEDGRDYWLVKNSWGTSWGLNGYIKMARNKGNQCGIATRAKYPLV